MNKNKEAAVKLRKLGKSYNDIQQFMHIPKSTLSGWFAKESWSQEIKKKLKDKTNISGSIALRSLAKVRAGKLASLYKHAQAEALREFHKLKHHPLFIAGLSLYWGEGNKATPGLVFLANSDPGMIKVFYLFLKFVCGVTEEKIRVYLHIYPDLNEETCKKYWIAKTGLSRYNFNSSVVIKGRHVKRRLEYGVCNIGTSSTYLKSKVFTWLDLLSKEFEQKKYFPRL